MNLLQSIFQNKSKQIINFLFFTFFICTNLHSEIPDKYKIETSLPECKELITKMDNCYGEYVFPRIEYKGEWKNGAFHGQGFLKKQGDIYIGTL